MSKSKTEVATKADIKEAISEIATVIEYHQPRELYYNTPRNYRYRITENIVKEKNNGISLTVPDLAFSTREILERYAAGIPIQNLFTPSYETDEDGTPQQLIGFESWNKMDYAEKEAYVEEVMQKKREVETRLRSEAQKNIEERRKKQYYQDVQNEIKRQEAAKKGSGAQKSDGTSGTGTNNP